MAGVNQNSQANSVKTILVVEDEALIALNQEAILTKNGYRVITAYDGEKAVRAVSEAAIDLILMDIDLGKGKMDGTEAAEIILRDRELPIIFLTSHSEKEMVDKVKGITRYGYVLKNAGEFVLLEAITMAFELFRSFLAIQEKERQLELALKESEWKYQFLLKNLDDIIYTIDMETEEFSFVSPAFERVLGYTLDDVEKMGGRKAFLSRVIQYGAFQEQLKALAEFAGGNAQGLRHISVWKAKDGTPKTLEDYWVPVYENGRIGTVHGVLRDISDRKRAEDALRESEDKYKTLIDNIPFAVFELDGTGTLITVNKTFADFIGPPRDELAGRNMADLFPPEAIDVRKNYVEKAITEKTIQRFTDELNGRIFQHIIVPLSARGGGRVQIIARDVTDEVAAKQESEEHRLFWEGIFHSSPDAVVALNDENAIAGWNEGAEKLFGYTAEEAEGSNVDDLVSGRNRETQAEAENITSRTMRGERIRPVETVRYRKDGTPVHVRIAGAPIIIGDTVSGVVGVYTDITDRVRAEEGLKNSLEEKEVLMKELNHRVKNNLAMISALIGLKDSALGGGTDVSDLVSQIDAIRLIHEKLDESEHIGAIDVREYLGDLLQTIFSSFSEGPVRVDINIENRQLNTKKAVSLGLIVNELATNAVKHGFTGDTEHRFSIGFTEDAEKGEYIAAVSNSGRPFPSEIDLNNSSTLGLRLISALTEQLNGTLELNRAPEPEFTIRFPAGG